VRHGRDVYSSGSERGIVLDEGTPPLPKGMRLRLEPIDMEQSLKELSQALRELARSVESLPEDYAENLDHYLHGQPKR